MWSGARLDETKRMIRWCRRRYRDRIWGVTPEMWLAISFTLFVLGASVLNAGTYIFEESEPDREFIYKFGAFLMFTGWAVFVFLIETVKSRNGYRHTFVRGSRNVFVGMSIPPPINQEWLSSVLLPQIERGWVPIESEPWFEPGFQFPQPPTLAAAAEKDDVETPVSASKKKRIRRKKTNNQISEVDKTESFSEIPGQTEVLHEIASGEQPRESNQEDHQSQSLGEMDDSYCDALEESVQVHGQQKDYHPTSSQARDSFQTSVEDRISGQTSDQSASLRQSSESQQTSDQQKHTHQTFKKVKPEKSDQTSSKTTISNADSSGGNRTSLGKISEQSNETSTQPEDSNQSQDPEQSADHPTVPKVGSDRMQPVGPKVASNLNPRQSTSKKRNRRRKK